MRIKSDLGFHQEFHTRNFSAKTILNCTDIFERRFECIIKWTSIGDNIAQLNRSEIIWNSKWTYRYIWILNTIFDSCTLYANENFEYSFSNFDLISTKTMLLLLININDIWLFITVHFFSFLSTYVRNSRNTRYSKINSNAESDII